MKNTLITLLFLSIFFLSCSDDNNPTPNNNNNSGGNLTDIDGNTYDTVVIGTQVWMKQNLKVSRFQNGDLVSPNLNDSGTFAIYDNNPLNNDIYGKLYDWYLVSDPRGLCPTGWHVPSSEEWNQLAKFLDSGADTNCIYCSQSAIAGGKMKAISPLWQYPNLGADNSSGFTGLPGGGSTGTPVLFTGVGSSGAWWSSTRDLMRNAYFIGVNYDSSSLFRNLTDWSMKFSVRCIRDSPNNSNSGGNGGGGNNSICSGGPSTVTDIDGNTYNVANIGSQCWIKENLKVSKYRNGDPIPTNLSNTTWQNTTSGAYAIYNNIAINDSIYGKLYNWYAVADPRGLCPTGWHVPNDAEWRNLETFLGMPVNELNRIGFRGESQNVGGKMKAIGLAGSGGLWNSPNTGATNSSGFTALPGGGRTNSGYFSQLGNSGNWWSSTQLSTTYTWGRGLGNDGAFVARGHTEKSNGVSVRCVRD